MARTREQASASIYSLGSTARKALIRFERATRAHELRGAAHPESWDEINREFRVAKRELIKLIAPGVNS